ncbi:ubiquinone biosynthesis protein [Kovacikia minuta CCNUW1]|uniref:Coq4 family protein n=1 Tax=Kovacikia minuta TaxID=2931930 RepID=UPI001CCC3C9B|nr:ubiquinone biosynthesis protein [Kovacikia minuta CCNUW1]
MDWMSHLKPTPVLQRFLLLCCRPRLFLRMLQVQAMPTFPPFLALLTGDSDLDIVGEMSATLLPTASFNQAATYLQQDPACAALIAERYMAPPHDLEVLLQYPQDSLGYIYAKQMKARGFRAEDLYEGMTINSDASYVEARLSQTHDIWHVVTGFGTTIADEIGLQAFHLPQFPYPLAVALLSSSMMSTLLFSPEELPQLLEAIRRGWEMGKLAKPLFAQKWEEGWEKPLAVWRSELGIQLDTIVISH